MASDTRPPLLSGTKISREKVRLNQGFHLSDWMSLQRNLSSPTLKKISLNELSQHSSKFDCWTAYNGKVYDLTKYFPYHPGGEKILMEAAGKDCTELFNKYHRWVNMDSMMSKCLIGVIEEEHPEDSKETELINSLPDTSIMK